jgi:hypothetical protein
MNPFCLATALRSYPIEVAKMLAYEAAAFAKIIEHRATQYRDTEPKEIELIREKADHARNLAATVGKLIDRNALAMAAYRLAEFAAEIGDRKLADEMVSLANSFVARAAA